MILIGILSLSPSVLHVCASAEVLPILVLIKWWVGWLEGGCQKRPSANKITISNKELMG